MTCSQSTDSSAPALDLGEPIRKTGLHAQPIRYEPIVNTYNYEWDEEDFFNKRSKAHLSPGDVVSAPWELPNRLEKYHMIEVAWGSRQAVEVSAGEILKKIRAHKWQGTPQYGLQNFQRSLVPEITYRDVAQVLNEANIVPALEIRQNCIVLCMPPLCCIILHDRVMIHVNNNIDLDTLLLKLERLTLAYSKRAEETQQYFIRYYADEPMAPVRNVPATRSMLLSEVLLEDAVSEVVSPQPIHTDALLEAGTSTVQGWLERNSCSEFPPPPSPQQPWMTPFDTHTAPTAPTGPPCTRGSNPPWNALHRAIMSGNVQLIQTIPRFVLFPLEFAFLEILISFAFDELNKQVTLLDHETQKIVAATRAKDCHQTTIEAIRDIKMPINTMLENVADLVKALHNILENPEDMAMMELTRLFYKSGHYNIDDGAAAECATGHYRRKVNNSGFHGPYFPVWREYTNPNLEILLEFFSQELGLIQNRVKRIASNIESAEKHIQMMMAFKRNQYQKWDIGCGIAAVGLGIGAVISGILGMNVPNYQESNDYAFNAYVIAIGICALGGFLLAYFVTFGSFP